MVGPGRPRTHRLALPLRGGPGGQPCCRLDERRVLGNPSIGIYQFPVCLGELGGLKHGRGAATEKFGSIGAFLRGDLVEPCHQVVIELDQYLSSRHVHMVRHMG